MQTTLIGGQVGAQNQLPGAYPPAVRLGRGGEITVSQLLARYAEANLGAQLFQMDSDSVTLAAANATKGALATVKLINGFLNPFTSGRNAILIAAYIATVSGTPGGPYFYNFLADSTINSASTGTIRSSRLVATDSSAMTPQTGVILANSAAATTALKQLGVMGGPAAVAAGAGLYGAFDAIDGRIIVPPGVVFGLTCLAAGTTHIVQSTLIWAEVPA